MIDLIIKNAVIVDGTNQPRYRGDVAIKQGKIIDIGNLAEQYNLALQLIDAQGHVLAPGFIDVHGHTDLFAYLDPSCGAKLKQGITTELGGQCGLTLFPVSAEYWEAYYGYYNKLGLPVDASFQKYTTADSYLSFMEELPLGINIGLFVGHGTIRLAAMGLNPQAPTTAELHKMKKITEEAMQSGVFGLSSGLMYAPGSFAKKEELVELCQVIAPYNGIYTSHIRNQGEGLEASVGETIDIGRKAGVAVNISHHKAVGCPNWHKVKQTSLLIKGANAEGLQVTHDVYPYIASSTTLTAALPPSCLEKGADQLLQDLTDADYLKQLEQQIFNPSERWDNDLKNCGYGSLLMIQAPNTPQAIGKTIEQYAKELQVDNFSAFIYLLVQNTLNVSDICFSMCEEDVQYLIAHEYCLFGTDSLYVPGMKMTHPRSIGTFPRILGRYVREKNLLSLEQAIFKMTGYAAQVYGLKGKGQIKKGYDADIVIFNPQTICDHADFTNPLQENEGIEYVFVNGQMAVVNNQLTNNRAGRVIRR